MRSEIVEQLLVTYIGAVAANERVGVCNSVGERESIYVCGSE